ncbi:MAG: hypothetical protein QOJ64_4165 [Acidobacteriota bacterium]|jgi:proteasome lid subunit RPN8/RPN11|nr:hypothetical protein [Acidobacteriota bacterium]
MLKNDYQYALMLYREGQASLGQVSIKVDWEPAREWAEFSALRQSLGHGLEPSDQTGRISTVTPIWHSTLGEPYLKGFRIDVAANRSSEVSTDFRNSYFRQLAKQASELFIERGALNKGDRFKYLVAAFPQQEKEQSPVEIRFTSEEVTPPLAVTDASLSELLDGAIAQGDQSQDDIPLIVPQNVLDEVKALSKQARLTETGGVLIGRLARDVERCEMLAQVTAQIPARHTEATVTSLTFTSETWTDVRAALELRRKGEIMLGWWHSHPVREWCKGCSLESQKVCSMASDFFSAHDRALHRTIFPRAYSVALVVNDLPADHSTYSMFGWRGGLLESRGFHISRSHGAQKRDSNGEVIAQAALALN